MKFSFYSLIPFLPLFCSSQFQKLYWIQFLCSQAHILAGWRLETRHFTLCCSILFFFITTLHVPHGKHRLSLSRVLSGVFTAPLHSNGRGANHIENSLSTVETCLPRRCLAMGIHVTICKQGTLFGFILVTKSPSLHCSNKVKTLVDVSGVSTVKFWRQGRWWTSVPWGYPASVKYENMIPHTFRMVSVALRSTAAKGLSVCFVVLY
jgi:hypothetical protein